MSANGTRNQKRRWSPCCCPICLCCNHVIVRPNVSTWSCCRRFWVTLLRVACLWKKAGSCYLMPSSTLPPHWMTAHLSPCGWTTWRSTFPVGIHHVLHPAPTTHAKAQMSGPVLQSLWTPALFGTTSLLHPAHLQQARTDTCHSQAGCPHLLTAIIQVIFVIQLSFFIFWENIRSGLVKAWVISHKHIDCFTNSFFFVVAHIWNVSLSRPLWADAAQPSEEVHVHYFFQFPGLWVWVG